MSIFVNRETELQLINESFTDLIGQKRLLRTPIIEVQGVTGIGKTSLLRQIEQRCQETQLPYLWVDVSQRPFDVAHKIISQVKDYLQNGEVSFDRSPVQATRSLLEHGPVVLLLDAIDSAYDEHLATIESFLQDLIDNERLFVVLTSKKEISFQQKRTVARKLKMLHLGPLSQTYCDLYIARSSTTIKPDEVRELIFSWTKGYPVAMNVAVEAINQGIDPQTEEGQKEVLARLSEQVINQEILGEIDEKEREGYNSLLRLLAVPRRFNLPIMQDLIEAFDQEHKQESSMGYFSLPREINQATGILNWDMSRAGFTIDEPIRTLLLLLLKTEQPERYFAIHEFMADINLRLAHNLTGSDRVRAVRERLYHLASNTSVPAQAERFDESLRIIAQEKPEMLQQFAREFALDSELHEALGAYSMSTREAIETLLQKPDSENEK